MLALALALRPPAPIAPSVAPVASVAVLEDPDNTEAAGGPVEVASDRSVRLQPLATRSAGADLVLQFWTKTPDAAAPTSLGIVPGNQPTLVGAEQGRRSAKDRSSRSPRSPPADRRWIT